MVIGMAFKPANRWRFLETQVSRLVARYYEVKILIGFPH